jgi:thiamine biosynthesis lipoprotein
VIAAHFDPATRKAPPRRFVTVMADRCVHADALTKVVLARGHAADGVLAAFGASAAICSAGLIWSVGGGGH